jgi:hypothetical protein
VLDVVYVAVMLGFVAVTALFMLACDRIVGSDEAALEEGVQGAHDGSAPGART